MDRGEIMSNVKAQSPNECQSSKKKMKATESDIKIFGIWSLGLHLAFGFWPLGLDNALLLDIMCTEREKDF